MSRNPKARRQRRLRRKGVRDTEITGVHIPASLHRQLQRDGKGSLLAPTEEEDGALARELDEARLRFLQRKYAQEHIKPLEEES